MAAVAEPKSLSLTTREGNRIIEIYDRIKSGQKDNVLSLRLKTGLIITIANWADRFFDFKQESRKKVLKENLIKYIKIASACRVGSDRIAIIVNQLIADEQDKIALLKQLVYKKRYETPEIVPQQFSSQFQELLPTKFNQTVDLYFLLDQMVGYVFRDGTKWIQGAFLNEVVV
jgi:hypothetical protein